MTDATRTLERFLADERGATAIEYAFIATLIAVAIVASVTTLGTKVSSSYANVGSAIP